MCRPVAPTPYVATQVASYKTASPVQAVVLASSADRICVGTFKDAKGQAPVLILDLSSHSTPTFGDAQPTLGLTQTVPVSGGNVNSLR